MSLSNNSERKNDYYTNKHMGIVHLSFYELFSKPKKINVSIKVVLDNLNGDKRVMEKGPFESKFPIKIKCRG